MGRVSPELAAATYDSTVKAVTPDGGIPENGLQLVIDQARNELKLSREIAPAEVADMSLLNRAQKKFRISIGVLGAPDHDLGTAIAYFSHARTQRI